MSQAQPVRSLLGDSMGGIVVLGILSLAVFPVPAWMLDLLLAASVGLSVLVFLLSIYVEKPLDFSAFPSVLLLVTLFRLSLNVATTRLILLHGGDGHQAAGKVIQSFGQFAIGGNYVVGAVVFLILVIVNFIVITKGADRISEVSARFTLDSLPGKQMAIDAELGAGFINEKEARARRKGLEQETEFHGAMDGASKFVRGDAVAGLLIVGINVVGGIVIGVAQHGMSLADAAQTYTLLSIGDGLVSQIPALMISTGAALLVTRGATGAQLTATLGAQLFSRGRVVGAVAAILGLLALIPGMPKLVFLGLAGLGWWISRRAGNAPAQASQAASAGVGAAGDEKGKAEARPNAPQDLGALLPVELLALEVGVDLLPMVDEKRGGELLSRVSSLRRQLALDLGFIVPPVHVRDDLGMRPGAYRVLISGNKVAQGEARANRLLAIDPTGRSTKSIQGEAVREPTFGLPAKWIASSDRGRAEVAGATVVEPSAAIATHLAEVIRRNAHELLGRREAQELLEVAGKHHGKVVEELIPHLMPLGEVLKVLRALLQEGVSIRDIRSILETLADHAGQVKDTSELTELVRQRLRRQLTAQHTNEKGELKAAVLDPRTEDVLRQGARGDGQSLSKLTTRLEEASRIAVERDEPAVLVVSPELRRAAAALALRHVPGLAVLSYRELDPATPFVAQLVISLDKELRP